jgi:hypothetical protein
VGQDPSQLDGLDEGQLTVLLMETDAWTSIGHLCVTKLAHDGTT